MATLIRDAKSVQQDVTELKKQYQSELERLQSDRDALSEEVQRLRGAVEEDIRYIDKDEMTIRMKRGICICLFIKIFLKKS